MIKEVIIEEIIGEIITKVLVITAMKATFKEKGVKEKEITEADTKEEVHMKEEDNINHEENIEEIMVIEKEVIEAIIEEVAEALATIKIGRKLDQERHLVDREMKDLKHQLQQRWLLEDLK